MLALDLTRIRAAEEHFEWVYAPEALTQEGDSFRVVAPVGLALTVYKDKSHFRLAGSVHGTLELSCSRCLEPFTWPVDASFDLRYQPSTQSTGDHEREVEADDLTTAFYENETIDLGQLMREQFYLALPMKPLCGDDCHGLCTQCGANLNKDDCGCQPAWEDPRLAVLKTLKTDQHRQH